MPKRIFKKLAPHPDKVKNHRSLKLIQHLLHDPNIWHFNRKSVPKAFLIGVFCAFMPVPFQMPLAAIAALALSANISLSIVLVWITNPLTMGPIFYAAYKLGCYILNTPEFTFNSEWSFSTIYDQIIIVWKPLWAGSLILGSAFALISYYATKILWYMIVLTKMKYRNS